MFNTRMIGWSYPPCNVREVISDVNAIFLYYTLYLNGGTYSSSLQPSNSSPSESEVGRRRFLISLSEVPCAAS